MNNCYNTAKKILLLNRIKFTEKYLKTSVLGHQDHNSLLALSDTLNQYNIENKGVKIDKERFDDIPNFSVLQIDKQGVNLFYTLKTKNKKEVIFFDENNKIKKILRKDFIKQWTGICLIIEVNKNSKEPGIKIKLRKKRILNGLLFSSIMLILMWFLLKTDISKKLAELIYISLKFVGLIIGVILLWYEIDKYNPVLKKFCSNNKNVNCDAVLSSKYSRIFNIELFSLSIIGFSYFFSTINYFLFQGLTISSIGLISKISLLTLPVVFISLFYQAIIIKQWCKLCIFIQVILIFESVIVYYNQFHVYDFYYIDILLFTSILILPIIVWSFLKPLLKKEKEVLFYKRGLSKVKNNPVVFKTLLNNSNTIKKSPEGLGIIFVNENARINILKICNPYCGPCAKAHPVLEKLYRSGKINLQILFTSKPDIENFKTKPVNHFLAIDSKNNKKITHEALDYWYMTENKDYENFSKKYPLDDELNRQKEKITAMYEWCKNQKITQTPTIFINNHELPQEYAIEDLKDILD